MVVKTPERYGFSSPLTRPGVTASADELRGRRKLCQLQCPCVEFVLDSHALELRVLGLIFGVENCLAESFENGCETCPFQRRRLWAQSGSNGQTSGRPCSSSGDDQTQHGIAALRAQARFQIQKSCKVCKISLKRKLTGQEKAEGYPGHRPHAQAW